MSSRKKVAPSIKAKAVPNKKRKKDKEQNTEFEVERIIEYAISDDGQTLYNVKWRGWDRSHSTWEPVENLTGCESAIFKYFRKTFGQDADVVKSQFKNEIENLKLELIGDVSRETLENIMQKFQYKKGLNIRYPSADDVDNDLVTLMRIPENERPAVYTNKVKKDLLLLALKERRQQQVKLLKEWEQKLNTDSRVITKNDDEIVELKTDSGVNSKNNAEIVILSTDSDGITKNDAKIVELKSDSNIITKNNAEIVILSTDSDGITKNDAEIVELKSDSGIITKNDAEIVIANGDMNNSVANNYIFVENNVDLEEPPPNFHYVTDYIPRGVQIPNDPLVGCKCSECDKACLDCCGKLSFSKFAYNTDGTIRVPLGTPIYECNKCCACSLNCVNRVVQKGCTVKLTIFRTKNGCGWGVKAAENIKRGAFVCEYVGEVITNDEAERRGKIYDAAGMTYLFDLDFNEKQKYTVDAAVYGNISHFINHSCNPNLAVFAVWVDCLDINLPKLALFTKRFIREGEELTFDYKCQLQNADSQENGEISSNPPSPAEENCETSSNNQLMTEENGECSSKSPSLTEEISEISSNLPSLNEENGVSSNDPSLTKENGDSPSSTTRRIMVCKCGASNCRKYIEL